MLCEVVGEGREVVLCSDLCSIAEVTDEGVVVEDVLFHYSNCLRVS